VQHTKKHKQHINKTPVG